MKKVMVMLIGILMVTTILSMPGTIPVVGDETPDRGTRAAAVINNMTIYVENTTINCSALKLLTPTTINVHLNGTDMAGTTVYMNMTGAITLNSTGTADALGNVYWEWRPEMPGEIIINAWVNSTVNVSHTIYVYFGNWWQYFVFNDFEHSPQYYLGGRLDWQTFMLSYLPIFEPSYAPYRVLIQKRFCNGTKEDLVEWVGLLDSHGYKRGYVNLTNTLFDADHKYELHFYVYNHTDPAYVGDVIIDSDGTITNGRGSTYEAGTYTSLSAAYGENDVWWYYDANNNDRYDVDTDTSEDLWTSAHGYLVGSQRNKRLDSAFNYNLIYFNDSKVVDGLWTNSLTGDAEDIWLDDGSLTFNITWDDLYPDEGYNGTPFYKEHHYFDVVSPPSWWRTSNTYTLKEGWNSIGWASEATTSTLLLTKNSHITIITERTSAGVYQDCIRNQTLPTVFAISRLEGIWVYSDADTTFTA